MTVPLAGYALLLVDDDAAMQPLLTRGLTRFGARSVEIVPSARRLRERLMRAMDAPPDAVILDLHLGSTESGIDLAHWMRSQPHLVACVRILYTGYAADDCVSAAIQQHTLHGVITKPQTLLDLATAIAVLVRAHQITRPNT